MSEQNSEIVTLPGTAAKLLLTDEQFLPAARLIGDLTEEQSAARVSGAPYTIGQLAAHLHYWLTREISRAQGKAVPPAPGDLEATFPVPAPGEWPGLRDRLIAAIGEAADAARASIEPSVLAEAALHNAYHLGQIALLRRIAGMWPPVGGDD